MSVSAAAKQGCTRGVLQPQAINEDIWSDKRAPLF